MLSNKSLSSVCAYKLNETYHNLFELQQKLNIQDDFLMSTSTNVSEVSQADDGGDLESAFSRLHELLEASKATRDNLITWYLKQTLTELNVTISLLTAKIKFIEYKLGLCEGLDLHQACSLSLVNFCNILSEMTVLNVEKSKRKPMHKISKEVNIPVWLSHYRNQICHMPSESPCISILVPLVVKSLDYMRESFWSKVVERETFDAKECRDVIEMISSCTHLTSINQRLELRKDTGLGKKGLRIAQSGLNNATRACFTLRSLLLHNPRQVVDIILNYIVRYPYNDERHNFSLLLKQVILARCFERFVFGLLGIVEERTHDKFALSWLQRVVTIVGLRRKKKLRLAMSKLDLDPTLKMIRNTDISPLRCSHLVHRLIRLDSPVVKKLVVRLRHKLIPLLGKKRTMLLIKLTRLAKEN